MPPTLVKPGLPDWMLRIQKHRGLIVPLAFIGLLMVVLVPMPAWLMDVLICLNISLSVIILLTTIYMTHPLDFSVFPSLLLATTLFRLVLNVASTRLILSAQASTPEEAAFAAGHVIQAFANFVAGDSLVVGIILFAILVIVQFVVITKGATRISEVAARFTLDAMPGKQMAIDADLNAGVIDEKEARRRRERIAQEADFFGAMDGASKFVRGDAIAGIIITFVNVIGGFAIGTLERGWPAGQTAHVFTLLTIGDGLTSQIPSFVVAIASALIVTRSGSKQDLGRELTAQLASQPVGLYVTGAFLGMLAFTPLPTIPLVATALALCGIAYAMQRSTRATVAQETAKTAAKPPAEQNQPEAHLKLDAVELVVGTDLVRLVTPATGGVLLDRIARLREEIAAGLGFIIPPVRIRDDKSIPLTEYHIKLRGAHVASGQTFPDRLLAMDSGITTGRIEGEFTREPVFGLQAWWIDPALQSRAELLNYTVVDPTTVIATHLADVLKSSAADLLTREEVNNLLAELKKKAPKLVEEVVPSLVKPGDLQRVLHNLLRERVSIKDLELILETLADWATKTKDLDVLTEYVRNALRRTICLQHAVPIPPEAIDPSGKGPTRRIVCVTLDPSLEDLISSYVDRSAGVTNVVIPPRTASQIATEIGKALQQLTQQGHQPVILASPPVRAVVRQIMEPHVPGLAVLGFNEIVPGVDVESVALVAPPPTGPQPAQSSPQPMAA